MINFKDFEYASSAKSFAVDGDIYSTSGVLLDKILTRVKELHNAEAKEEATQLKQALEAHMGCEVADGDFKTFAEFEGKIFMFVVNRADGFKECIKMNKKRPTKFKGHACNIQDTTPLFI